MDNNSLTHHLSEALVNYIGDGVYFSYIQRRYHYPHPPKWWQLWRVPQPPWHEDVDLRQHWLKIVSVEGGTLEFAAPPPAPGKGLNIQGFKLWLDDGDLLDERRWSVDKDGTLILTDGPKIIIT